jgi:hypothetical protein
MLVTDYSPNSGLCGTGFTPATSKTPELCTHTSNAISYKLSSTLTMLKITVITNESEKVTLLLTKTFPPPADTEQ